MRELLIVDGNSLANRAYYALPFLSTKEGTPSGAVFGFANILLKIIQSELPDDIVVAFDHARKTFRNDIYPEYKMQRKPAPEELIVQFPYIKEMLETMNIKVIEQAGIEADDIIGTVTKNYQGKKVILSGDRDLLQLIDDDTQVWLTKKGVTEIDKVDQPRLKELFGIEPYQVIEIKALMGDASDNIPGVKGVGEKTALNLLNEYQTIENVYENIDKQKGKLKEKLVADKNMAFISKTLATIKRDCDITFNEDEIKLKFPFQKKCYEFFKKWNFVSLVKNHSLYDASAFVENAQESEEIKKEVLNKNNIAKIKEQIDNDFCYDLSRLEFFAGNTIYYLPQNYSMFEENLSTDEACNIFKDIFENKDIVKVSLNPKHDKHLLEKIGIKLVNYFDLSLADYVANGGIKILDIVPVSEFEKYKNRFLDDIKQQHLEFVYDKIEKPLTDILYKMENFGFAINQDKLEEIDNEYTKKIDDLTKLIYHYAGEEFNLNSPKQVASILFDKLGLSVRNNKKQSTNAQVLDQLRGEPIVDAIISYRKASKLKSGYIDVYKQICLNQGNIIHTTFNQSLTTTGRLSSSEPNLQNIPTRDDEGKILRKIFVSKFEGGKLISSDYSQIELRLLADMSGEEKLIKSYNDGIDIHSNTASQIFGIPVNEVTESQRREAKAVNFGIIYGISDYGLSQNIKSSVIRAKEYIESYFLNYPKVKVFMDENVAFAKEHGFSITKFGRKRRIPEISSSKYVTRTFGERVAMNMPLQGTASDIIKLAMINVFNKMQKLNLKSQLILQIHDELIVDVYPGELEIASKILKEEMENVCSLKVPLKVSMGSGESLYDCKW